MTTPDQKIRGLLGALDATHDNEIDCETFIEHAAALVEARRSGGPLPSALELAELHEKLCANCREECSSLAAALAALGDNDGV